MGGGRLALGPSLCPYSPECVEGEFSEVGLPFYGVLRNSRSPGPTPSFMCDITHLSPRRPKIEVITRRYEAAIASELPARHFVAAFSVRGSTALMVAVECRRVATSGDRLWDCLIGL